MQTFHNLPGDKTALLKTAILYIIIPIILSIYPYILDSKNKKSIKIRKYFRPSEGLQ